MTKQLHKLLLLVIATFLKASGYAHNLEINVNSHNLNADFKIANVPLKDELFHSSDDNYIRYSPFYHDETTPSTPVTDQLVKEIITEFVSRTGGIIIQQKKKDNGDTETQIALPADFDHYKVTKALSPLMKEIESFYFSLMPWKILENGYLCNFNMAKDGSNRTLSVLYMPENKILYISDSPSNSPNLKENNSFIDKLQNLVIWGSVYYLDGFIRDDREDNSTSAYVHSIGIQLQVDATPQSIVSALKPTTTVLDTMYHLAEPWKMDDKGILECEYFCQLDREKKNMFIHFYYFPTPQVLAIDFIIRTLH